LRILDFAFFNQKIIQIFYLKSAQFFGVVPPLFLCLKSGDFGLEKLAALPLPFALDFIFYLLLFSFAFAFAESR